MIDLNDFHDKYTVSLRLFFEQQKEKALFEVSELGKELVLSRLGPDVLLDIHSVCLKETLKDIDPVTISRMVVNANDFLLNGIMAYAMNYYSFIDILEAEKQKLEKAESEIKEKADSLELANTKLKELDRLKSMFIASMSHELRTPLNSVIGFSTVLLQEWKGPLNEEQKTLLAIVQRAGRHLLALINDVIDVSRIEAGTIEIREEDFDLGDLISEAVDFVAKDLREKRLDLHVDTVHCPMHTDRRRLLQCILNLLNNAAKFTLQGGVTLTAEQQEEMIEISVRDTGIGIREEDIPRLFQSFVRLDSPLRATVLGTGLGLYLTRKLAREVLGGDIRVESALNKGSRFTLRLPIRIETRSETA